MESKIAVLTKLPTEVMSNLGHEINYEVAKQLKNGKCYAQYSGWNFCGWVYWDILEKKFICEVWVFNSLREIFKYATLQLIMENVCKGYGEQ